MHDTPEVCLGGPIQRATRAFSTHAHTPAHGPASAFSLLAVGPAQRPRRQGMTDELYLNASRGRARTGTPRRDKESAP